jgi:hypothetical protein
MFLNPFVARSHVVPPSRLRRTRLQETKLIPSNAECVKTAYTVVAGEGAMARLETENEPGSR